jgi:hypothetical protein
MNEEKNVASAPERVMVMLLVLDDEVQVRCGK